MAAQTKPNVLVILVDDMGFSDIGCYGGEIPTPNLDNLAKNGVRFTQFYNTGRCCPTRASLLTGLYPHQAGVGHMMDDHHFPGYSGRLNDRCATMGEVMQPAGYATAMCGKWHVGQHAGVVPWKRGFGRTLSASVGGFYFPDAKDADVLLDGKVPNELPRDWYSTDLWAQYTVKFVDEARAQNKPFFQYLAFNAPHFPLQAPAEDIARFRGRYKKGWDAVRQARLARQKSLGMAQPGWDLATRPEAIRDWERLTEAEKDRFDHIMATYAACVYHMDKAVGSVVDALKQRSELDNTLILFMSDNGGNAESGPDGIAEGDPSRANSKWFCGQSWAWAQNTPFRMYKHYTHEGGISTPLIAHWPQGIDRHRNGALEAQPCHLIDIMATVADVGKAPYPKGKIKPMEGVSLRPAFGGKPLKRPGMLFWEHEENRAVRDGKWKLVAKAGEPWELYDINTDRSEQNSLAQKELGRVAAMAAAWDKWAARADVLPLGGWRNGGPLPTGSFAARFVFKKGDTRQGNDAPAVASTTLTMSARFDTKEGTEGVVIAQGGGQHGYALFVQNGKLNWRIRTSGQVAEVSLPIAPGAHTAIAYLGKTELRLQLDGKTVTAPSLGRIMKQPQDGLTVGQDDGGAVGTYAVPFRFTGIISSVEITRQKDAPSPR